MSTTIKALAILTAIGAPALQAQADREAASAKQRIDRVTSSLTLTAGQQSQLDALAARYQDAEPGDSWRLAADVEAILTDQQVRSLAEKREAQRSRRAERYEKNGADRHRRGRDKQRGQKGRRHKAGRHLDLTEAQREQMSERHQAVRAEREALRTQLQSDAITAEQFTERTRALREQAKSDLDAMLTPEQRRKKAEAEAHREAIRTARETVLQITPEQRAAFETARAEAARSDTRSAMRGRETDILTKDQREIMAVHRALVKRPGQHGHHGRRGAHPESKGRDAAPKRDAATK